MTQFCKDWIVSHVLGEGAFGEVKLLVNKLSGEAVAAKVIDLDKHKAALNTIKKEIMIHKLLDHENVIKFYGCRTEDLTQYIFLEYASGGELFDRIEPDVGMPQKEALLYFDQLMDGVKYLHERGIAHRDLKPENLLLNTQDILKISDFGTATIFRHQGKERMLSSKCGTVPYMSPEVFAGKEYHAEPADLWSCGIILVALLTGELPFDKPTKKCQRFKDWKEGKMLSSPWRKIDTVCLSLLKKMLQPNPQQRYSLEQVLDHKWLKKCYLKKSSSSFCGSSGWSPGSASQKKFCPRVVSASQPSPSHSQRDIFSTCSQPYRQSFSQPCHPEDMIINTQLHSLQVGSSQSGPSNAYQRLVKRMTRFFVNTNSTFAIQKLNCCCNKQGYQVKKCADGTFTISLNDRRKMPLVFKANVIEITTSQLLVDFRLSRGDGIEFKRHFLFIRNAFKDSISNTPLTWSLAAATNTLP